MDEIYSEPFLKQIDWFNVTIENVINKPQPRWARCLRIKIVGQRRGDKNLWCRSSQFVGENIVAAVLEKDCLG